MLLERILSNLMTNSIKYRTGSRGKVCIRLSALKGKAVISFSDDGPGVPESSVSRLFELFYRTDAARSHPQNGSGLGLTIAARAMALMGGSARAENRIPHGLKIELIFPLRKEDPHE